MNRSPSLSPSVTGAPRAWLRAEGFAVLALATGRPATVALIWAAHIGFDRLLGCGLKYPTAFRNTHLGRLGDSDGRPTLDSPVQELQ